MCGIQDERLQRRLLAEPDLTFKKAFDIAQAYESAESNAKALRTSQPVEVHATKMSDRSGASSRTHRATAVGAGTGLQTAAFAMLFATTAARKATSREPAAAGTGLRSTSHFKVANRRGANRRGQIASPKKPKKIFTLLCRWNIFYVPGVRG